MSNAHTLLAEGRLGQAVTSAFEAVRGRPTDASARLLLVDLLCLSGQWDRASKQLDVMETQGSSPGDAVAAYRLLIDAERARRAFAETGAPAPGWIVEPPAWAADHLAGCEALRLGDAAAASERLGRSAAAQSTLSGTLDGVPFEGFRDLDDAAGPLLEVMTQAGWMLAPWEDVRYLDVAPPVVPRDLLWAPARLSLNQGPIGKVYLPALYPGQPDEPDDQVRLGRKTDWRELGSGFMAGLGLKMFLVGDEARTLFELRELTFGPPTPPAS